MVAATKTHAYLRRHLGAIDSLQTAQCMEAVLMLTYAGIDHLSWLTHADDETGGAEFKAWSEKYLDLNAIGCTSDDLWGARCGLLHTAAAESRDFHSGRAKNVYYIDADLKLSENPDPNVVFVQIASLIKSFIEGACRSVDDCKSDSTKLALMEGKASRMLAWRPYPHK